jgi:putative mRNA 3-end processing factor
MQRASHQAESWLKVTRKGLYCEPGDFYVDPALAVDRALITHAHGDHARPGNKAVLATKETLRFMRLRYGKRAGHHLQAVTLGEVISIGPVKVSFYPAGHVLGSCQILLEYKGCRVVVSGDYKRRPDPTTLDFEVVPCHVFITEATFGLPVFEHPPVESELEKLTHVRTCFPERTLQVSAYSLGKCQRLIAELRRAGIDEPIYLHGSQYHHCEAYQELGVNLGELRSVESCLGETLKGAIVFAPLNVLFQDYADRILDPISTSASGWLRVRSKSFMGSCELPLIISDHVDWPELTQTIEEVNPEEVWVTHGSEEATIHWCRSHQRRAKALSLVGRGDGEE